MRYTIATAATIHDETGSKSVSFLCRSMRMASPLIYVAMSHELCRELLLDEQLVRLEGLAQIERWPGPGNPPLEAVEQVARRAQILLTGWGTPALCFLTAWEPEAFAVRLVAHSAGTVKYLVPVEA